MSRTLYLLVTSERPDAYLNSLVHCILHEGVREVTFVYIHGLDDSSFNPGSIPSDKKSDKVMRWVNVLLEDLATIGEYRYFSGEHAGSKVDLRQVYPSDHFTYMQDLYKHCLRLGIQWNHRDLPYLDLRKEISFIAKKKSNVIVDVSSINKKFIGDLIAVSVIEGLNSLYTFDLVQPPDFKHPWKTLFHDLSAGSQSEAKYNYVNILNTKLFQECSRSLLVKRPSFKFSLALSVALLSAALTSYLIWGSSNSFLQITFLVSAIASILSTYYSIWPLRL